MEEEQTPSSEAMQSLSVNFELNNSAFASFFAATSQMIPEERFRIVRSIGEECIKEDELLNLLSKKPQPICYDGFKPSGRMHIAQAFKKAKSMRLGDLDFSVVYEIVKLCKD